MCASLKRCNIHWRIKQVWALQSVGISLASDVLSHTYQCILVLCGTITSCTAACLTDNDQFQSVRPALIQLSLRLRPLDGPFAVIRTYSAPSFCALVKEEMLHAHWLSLELGHAKTNINKNPVVEKAMKESEEELG